LDQAVSLYHEGAYEKALGELSAIVERWPGSEAARIASVYVGHSYLRLADYGKAASAYGEFLRSGRGDEQDYLRQLALLKLGEAEEHASGASEALKHYSQAAELPGPYASEALLAKARLLESIGKKAEATETYRSFATRYPQSPFVELARVKAEMAGREN
jgi:TolA-binding protein